MSVVLAQTDADPHTNKMRTADLCYIYRAHFFWTHLCVACTKETCICVLHAQKKADCFVLFLDCVLCIDTKHQRKMELTTA